MSPKWWDPSPPGVVPAIPWLSPDAIYHLERLIEPHFRVVEHGSGGSTMWFAERAAEVVAVESNGDWYGSVVEAIPANVEVILSDEPGVPKKLIRRKGFDLLLIDGMPVEARAAWLDAAEKLVKTGGIVVLDNANRPEYAEARARLQARAEVIAFIDGNSESGGTKYLTTEFYRLPGKAAKEVSDADRD